MGKKSKKAPKVDTAAYDKLFAAQTAAAQQAAQTSADQLAWAKEAYAQDRALADPIIKAAMERMETQDAWAQADRDRQSKFQAAEDRMLEDAMSYDSPERKAQATAAAMSDVYAAMEGGRQASQRMLESYGVDPSSTRYGALDIAHRAQAAANAVAAGNRAALEVEKTGRELRKDAIGVGQYYGTRSLSETALAGQQGAGALAAALGTTASGANTMGTGMTWAGLQQGALSGAGTILDAKTSAQMERYKAQTAADAVLPTAIGQLAGTAAGIYAGTLAEGGAITPNMSPSGGERIDDVPILATAGEFVIPADVVKRKGEDFFERLIAGSRKTTGGALAGFGQQPQQPQQPQQQKGAIYA